MTGLGAVDPETMLNHDIRTARLNQNCKNVGKATISKINIFLRQPNEQIPPSPENNDNKK